MEKIRTHLNRWSEIDALRHGSHGNLTNSTVKGCKERKNKDETSWDERNKDGSKPRTGEDKNINSVGKRDTGQREGKGNLL